jgi:hypothetical protein
MLAATAVLLAAADAASAKNGGGSAGSKHAESHEDKAMPESKQSKNREDKSMPGSKYPGNHEDKGKVSAEKHKDQGKEYASKTSDKDGHKPAPAPGTGGTNNIHPSSIHSRSPNRLPPARPRSWPASPMGCSADGWRVARKG